MRVSSLMNRKAFQCLVNLQEFEPALYDKLLERSKGVKTASIYAKEKCMFSTKKLPENFKNWKEYRDFLLMTLENKSHVEIFIKKFEKDLENEFVYKQQVKQILLHDIGSSKVINGIDPNVAIKQKWMAEL